MAKRGFTLPGIHELSKEQEDARALPKTGQHLIIGAPGTGKSVLALLRSKRHIQDEDDYVFLVFNHLLRQASRQLFNADLSSDQWQSWFFRTFREMTGEAVPQLSPDGKGWREIDWQGVSKLMANLTGTPSQELPFLIIDEGQDMPPAFYEALVSMGFENFYVVADQNQQIELDRNSTRQDIQNCLGIDPAGVIELRDNYRNTHAVASLAREFYTGDPASPPPDLPKETPSAKRPLIYEYKPDRFSDLIDRILKNLDNHPEKLFGIIAPNNQVREQYYDALKNSTCQLDHGYPRIETYANGKQPNLLFNEGGIMVINAQSCKGLEFDTVFLADINEHLCNPGNLDHIKRLFYVMVARARDQVVMLKEAGKHCPVEAILPKDTNVLERK